MTQKTKTALVGVCALLGAAVWVMWPDRTGRHAATPTVGDRGQAAAIAAESQPSSRPASRMVSRAFPGEPGADAVGPRLEIEVVWSDGAAVGGAPVIVFRDETVIASGDTDAQGLVRLAGREGDAKILVTPKSAPPTIADVAIATGRHRVAVERGVSIAGRVEVDGQAPTEPFEITLGRRSEGPSIPSTVRRLPDARLAPRFSVDASGRFELRCESLAPAA